MSEEKIPSTHRDYISALETGLEVLGAFDGQHNEMTLSQVAEKMGIDRAKARRFLLTLHSLGYIRRDGRIFALTPKVLSLGQAYTSSNGYIAVIEHYLKSITAELGESASLGKLEGHSVVYVARSSASYRLMSINITIGTRLPAQYTSLGRVLAAQFESSKLNEWVDAADLHPHTDVSITSAEALKSELTKVKQQGFSIVDQELEAGLRSIAVPVFTGSGELLGAMNLSNNALRISLDDIYQLFIPVLRRTAEQIKKDLR
jgi:IclR family pca regulon transcriptional regulator